MSTGRSRLIAARALAHEAALVEVIPALAEAGISPILFKGMATIRLLYGDGPHSRDSDDIDLLVSPAEFDATLAVLADLGFVSKWGNARASEHPSYEETVRRPGPVPVTIDLHRSTRLVPDGGALHRVLVRDSQTLGVGPVQVRTPSDAACTALLALHAAQHGPRVGRPLDDLARACRSVDVAGWAAAAALATELAARDEFTLGLSLVPDGEGVLASLGLTPPNLTAMADLEERLRLRGHDGATRWLLVALRNRDLRGLMIALANGFAPSPAAVRVYYHGLEPGWRPLVGAYLRRLGKAPRYSGALALEAQRVLARKLPGYLRGLIWSVRSTRRARAQLRAGGLAAVALRSAPEHRPGTQRGVIHGLVITRPSCLERALVRREWHLAQGRDIPIVIGVRRSPDAVFGAHAWLRGDPPDPGNFAELATWPS